MRTALSATPLLVATALGACGSDTKTPNGATPPVSAPSSPGADSGPPTSGGGTSPWQGLPGERMGPLAKAASARTATFMTHDECAFCHTTETGSSVLRDAKGRDVSPVESFRGSMMGLAARDPYYLAVLEHELGAHPGAEATVMSTCTRCHAPAGNVELAKAGKNLTYGDLTTGTSPEATVGRDGVTCSLCHQITPQGLGTPASFTGGYTIDANRTIYGPHASPFATPMVQRVNYTPTASSHMTDSGLCGSCHTVVTRALDTKGAPTGPEVLEQGPFVEWSVSRFAKPGGKTCQDCHVPVTDDDGAPISTVLSLRPGPGRLSPRSPVGRHLFSGANALMLRVLANERAWAGYDAPAELLFAQAERAEASLRTAARLTVLPIERAGEGASVRVRVENLTGHKLPTAYPSRRMWLHVRVTDAAGALVLESGAARDGRIVDGAGNVLDAKGAVLAHTTEITSSTGVSVWEAIPKNAEGREATSLLEATGYAKDDRLLPEGFDAADPRATLALPVGTAQDGDFVPGGDTVLYRVPRAPAGSVVEVRLLYQTIRPSELEHLAEKPGPAALRFLDMIGPNAMAPLVVATARATVP
ncbi:MAG: hypothetical protein U0183_32870 [Polyangiaceae bacterium]